MTKSLPTNNKQTNKYYQANLHYNLVSEITACVEFHLPINSVRADMCLNIIFVMGEEKRVRELESIHFQAVLFYLITGCTLQAFIGSVDQVLE